MITPEQLAKNGLEHGEQAALFQWAALAVNGKAELYGKTLPPMPELALLFAIPNGDQRGDGSHKGAQIAGARLKAEGQRSGVPDVFLPVPRIRRSIFPGPSNVTYHGCFIEMKKRDLQRLNDPFAGCSDDQKRWIPQLRSQQYYVQIAYGWEMAARMLHGYLEGV